MTLGTCELLEVTHCQASAGPEQSAFVKTKCMRRDVKKKVPGPGSHIVATARSLRSSRSASRWQRKN
jgi:hypothetical protein